MRLLKKRTPDSPPELVSASPISQDYEYAENEKKDENEKNDAMSTSITETSPCKGILKLGRKMGQKWDKFKKSEKSDILNVSGKKCLWSPNGQHCIENATNSSKPTKIFRVESLRNLFSKSIKTDEENRSKMSKSLSDSFVRPSLEHRKILEFELLKEQKRRDDLTEKKQSLCDKMIRAEEQVQVLDLFLSNPDILSSTRGTEIASQALKDLEKSPRRASVAVVQLLKKENDWPITRSISDSLTMARRNSKIFKQKQPSLPNSLSDLVCNMKLSYEDSNGYDSDTTHAVGKSSTGFRKLSKFLHPPENRKKTDFRINEKPDVTRMELEKTPPKQLMRPPRIDEMNSDLLMNCSSPCKDTPPSKKFPKKVLDFPSTPKRPRSLIDNEVLEEEKGRWKRPAICKVSSPRKIATRRLFKSQIITIRFNLGEGVKSGVELEQKKGARLVYLVKNLEAECEAAKMGLRVGDRINQVCGINLRSVPNVARAQNLLDSCVGEVVLRVAREPVTDFDTESDKIPEPPTAKPFVVGAVAKDGKYIDYVFGNDTPAPTENLTGMKKFFVKNRVGLSKNPKTNTKTILLKKSPSQKLGFSIVGGLDAQSVNRKNVGIFVMKIIPGGAAEEALLRPYDEILSVNGNSTEGMKHDQALQLLKEAKQRENIVLIIRRNDHVDKQQ